MALRTASAIEDGQSDWARFPGWANMPKMKKHDSIPVWPALPSLMAPAEDPLQERPLLAAMGLLVTGLLLAVAFFVWIHTIVRQLFLIGKFNPDPLRFCGPEQLKKEIAGDQPAGSSQALMRALILSPPRSGTTALVRGSLPAGAEGMTALDLAVEFDVDAEKLPLRRARLVDRHRRDTVVNIDNFEWRFRDEIVRLEALRLVEGLVNANGPAVRIFSSIDPVLYVEAQAAEASGAALQSELVRWTRVLGGFEKFRYGVEKDLTDSSETVRKTLRDLNFKPNEIDECEEVFLREFGGPPLLCSLASAAAKRVSESRDRYRTPAQFERFVLEQAADMTDEYFRILWSLTTASERLVLYQLAMDGWMNPLNEAAISHLVRKQLIVNGGRRYEVYELFSEAFRRFVKQNQDPREAAAWSLDQRESAWHGLRVGIITLVVLFLIWLGYVRHDLFDRYVGYVVTVTGGSAAMLRLVWNWFTARGNAAMPRET